MERIDSYSSWNETSNSSKLSEIYYVLEVTEWDSKIVKVTKKNLQSLLYAKKYKEFQKKIWMNIKDCDWKLGEKTFDQLTSYILWVYDKKLWVMEEIESTLYRLFKFWRKDKNKDMDDKLVLEQSNDNCVQKNNFFGRDISFIQSYPRMQNKETESYRCSMTARINWLNFWLNLPKWNAYVAWTIPGSWSIQTLPRDKVNERPKKTWAKITMNDWKTVDDYANFADFFVDSKTDYWHRAIAFKDDLGQRYVLDPYIKVEWKLSQKPIKLESYLNNKKILKVNFYHSEWYCR